VKQLGLAMLLASCASRNAQPPEVVGGLFADALSACTAPLNAAGTFDQRAVGSAGWKETKRTSRFEATERTHPPGSSPVLRDGEYEASEWVHAGRVGTLEVIRWDLATHRLTDDSCSINARLDSRSSVSKVVSGLSERLGRAVDREGDLPQGGDFLLPRAKRDGHGYFWQLPQHDVYLTVEDGTGLLLRVSAIADRAARDPFSPDRPEARIP
jgi:hypothetical protein